MLRSVPSAPGRELTTVHLDCTMKHLGRETMSQPRRRTVQEDIKRRRALRQALAASPFTKKHFAKLCGVSPSHIYALTGNALFSHATGVSDRLWALAMQHLNLAEILEQDQPE